MNPALRQIPDYLAKDVKRLAHPLTQKVKDRNRLNKRLGNVGSLNEAIKKRKKMEFKKKKHEEKKAKQGK